MGFVTVYADLVLSRGSSRTVYQCHFSEVYLKYPIPQLYKESSPEHEKSSLEILAIVKLRLLHFLLYLIRHYSNLKPHII